MQVTCGSNAHALMDGKASAAQNYLEHMLFNGSVKPTKLPLSLLEAITNNFSGDHEIGRGGFAVVYKVCVTLSLATQLCFCLAAAVLETRLHADKCNRKCRE